MTCNISVVCFFFDSLGETGQSGQPVTLVCDVEPREPFHYLPPISASDKGRPSFQSLIKLQETVVSNVVVKSTPERLVFRGPQFTALPQEALHCAMQYPP